MPETIYVLTNESMPGLVKIGRTDGTVADRMRGLDVTSTPLPFECFYAAEVANADRAERAIHEAFGDHRVRRNREFFRLSPEKPKAIIELLCLREVTPRNVIGEAGEANPDDVEALENAKRRRSNFSFTAVNISVGSKLQSVFDERIECEVAGDREVRFRDEEMSLSRAALIIAHEAGRAWKAIAGPDYWKYDGRTLSEIRDEMREKGEE